MAWFKRTADSFATAEKKELPENLWIKCPRCNEIIYRKEMEINLFVCTNCEYHFRLGSYQYPRLFFGDAPIKNLFDEIQSVDPLRFEATKKYENQLVSAAQKTNLPEAVRAMQGEIETIPVVMCMMDFSFIGGSMGSAVGEIISRSVDYAKEQKMSLIIVSASGGARMMEGAFSLMQMAKISAKLARFSENGGFFLSILTDPTTGGVTASFAMLGDIIIAEPGALIGFAGQRVIKQTIGADLPEKFQTSEFLLEKGFVDRIVPRKEMKSTVSKLLRFFTQ